MGNRGQATVLAIALLLPLLLLPPWAQYFLEPFSRPQLLFVRHLKFEGQLIHELLALLLQGKARQGKARQGVYIGSSKYR